MAQEVEIFFKVDGLETYITDLNDLEKVLNQVKGATDATAAATKDLEKDVDDATKGIEESERRLNALEGGIKTLAGSFEILAGSAALLGLEDNEFFGELEKNVVGVLALSQGVIDATEGIKLLSQNTKLAAVAQRIFNTVAKANPYILLATAVIALAGALLLFTRRSKDAEKQQIAENKARRKAIELANKQAKENSEQYKNNAALRVISRSENEKELQSVIDLNQGYIDESQARIAASERQIRDARVGAAVTNQAKAQQTKAINDALKVIEEESKRIEENTEFVEAAKDRLEELNEKKEESAQLTQAETLALEQAIQTQINIANEQNQLLDELAEAEEEDYRRGLTQREQEERDIENTYYERLNLANGNAELIKQVEEQFEKDKQTLRDRYAEEEKQANQEKLDELLAQQENYNQQLIAAEEQLQAAKINAAQQGFALLSELAGENENLQKVLFVASQAFEAAQVAIQGTKDIAQVRSEQIKSTTQLGAQAAVLTARLAAGDLTAAPGLAAVQGSIAAVNAGATASIAGIKLNTAAGIAGILAASIGQLRSAKDTGGGTTQITATAASPRAALPSFTTSQGEDIILGEPRSQQQGGGGPIQAYVIASDVTSAQQANQQIENLSRL